MLLANKVCRYIRPESLTNPDAEAWEYFLVWIGVDGGVYCWLFEDFERKKNVTGEIINTKSDYINKLYQNANNSVTLFAEDLTENEFDVISKITLAKIIRRYYKDKTYDNLTIITSEIIKPKSQFRYNLTFEVQEKESNILQ